VKRAIVVGLACALGCASDEFVPVSVVDSLRVLAVRADKPIAAPGETVHLEALVADPHDRTPKMAWSSCINPGSEEVTACADAAGPFALGATTRDYTVPSDALATRPSDAPIGVAGILFAACAGDVAFERTPTAPVRCIDNGRDVGRDGFMWGEKRIIVAAGVRNQNPKIAEVRFDGAAWDPASPPMIASCNGKTVDDCGDVHTIEVVATPDSAEPYGQFTEDLVAFYFVSGGRVADDFAREEGGAFKTKIAAAGVASGTKVRVWFVLRDDRGGVDWQERAYRVP